MLSRMTIRRARATPLAAQLGSCLQQPSQSQTQTRIPSVASDVDTSSSLRSSQPLGHHSLYRVPPLLASTTKDAVAEITHTVEEMRSDPRILEGPVHFLSTWICFFTVAAICLGSYQRINAAQLDADPTRDELNTKLMLGWGAESRTATTPVGV